MHKIPVNFDPDMLEIWVARAGIVDCTTGLIMTVAPACIRRQTKWREEVRSAVDVMFLLRHGQVTRKMWSGAPYAPGVQWRMDIHANIDSKDMEVQWYLHDYN